DHTLEKIHSGNLKRGFYYLENEKDLNNFVHNTFSNIAHVTSTFIYKLSSFALWHFMFGHVMCVIILDKRNFFIQRVLIELPNLFQLVHMDIWGLYSIVAIHVIKTEGPEFILGAYYIEKGIVYHTTCVPSRIIEDKSPFQLLYNSLLDLDLLQVFACLCYASTLTAKSDKFDSKAHKCVFIGYRPSTKGFLAYELHTKEVILSRNVKFHKLLFPYSSHHDSNSTPQ
ncbi:hypothetical protein CR513_52940, partial [Mucuna pruriens]